MLRMAILTGMFSQLDPQDSNNVIQLLRDVADKCDNVEDWIVTQGHVINCVDKLSSDLSALVRQCQDIVGPFYAVLPDEASPFVHWFRQASEHTSQVHCRFADDPQKRSMIADMRMQHLDNMCLGDRFTDDAFAFISESRHFDLMRPEVFMKHMKRLMVSVSS